MGNLPSARVTPSSVFTHVGVDYAGPIKMRAAAGRGRVSYPGYIAVFICFSTKAVHLEAVTSYDTPHFMAALKRMISRRGMCTDIYSDQGTNFVGASNVLHQMFKKGSAQMNSIQHQLSSVGITWHFNPPGAPHMGGLWEAAVKSCKFHIKRVIGDSTLTYEEMSTLLASIEACMNSRPICAISDDPSDNCILTPAHFLTGRTMVCLPETSVLDVNIPPSRRWLLLNQMRDRFWVTWRQVYLQQLQTRVKWQTPQRNISVGDLVLVKSETTTPAQWPLAIVIALHRGQDGLVRSVRVKTSTTQLSRPVVKLILLPVT